MPRQVLPSEDDFRYVRRELLKRGFRRITRLEKEKQFVLLGLMPPRRGSGEEARAPEAGFRFDANGLTVSVWTTWLPEFKKVRKEDSGWVLISEGNTVLYFAQPLHRTKNFKTNLLKRAWLARYRVLHRPLCPECNRWMSIARGKGIGSRYWRCDNIGQHTNGKAQGLDWDHKLPPKAKKEVKRHRKERARNRQRRRAQGRPVDVARLRRRTWRSKGPD